MYFNVIDDILHVPAPRNIREVRPEGLTSNSLSNPPVDTVAVAVLLRHHTGPGLPVQSLMLYCLKETMIKHGYNSIHSPLDK